MRRALRQSSFLERHVVVGERIVGMLFSGTVRMCFEERDNVEEQFPLSVMHIYAR